MPNRVFFGYNIAKDFVIEIIRIDQSYGTYFFMKGNRDIINVGIIGLGYWGPHYVRIFSQMHHTRVELCSDINTERLEHIKNLFPGIQVAANVNEVINCDAVDAVVIATPATSHYPLAREALESGKDVLVEKPMVIDTASGAELVSMAKSHKRVLMVGHTFLFNPGIIRMKEVLDSGEAGEIYYLHSTRTNLGPIREDVNALWDLAPHDVSIFSYLLGTMPEAVCANGACFLKEGREDVVFLTLYYPHGKIGNVHVSWIDSNKVRKVVVIGSRQRISFDDLDPLERVKIFEKGAEIKGRSEGDFGKFQLLLRDGDIYSPKVEPIEPLMAMCSHFVDCVSERNNPKTDGKHGLEVVAVLDAAQKSLSQNGKRVEVPSLSF